MPDSSAPLLEGAVQRVDPTRDAQWDCDLAACTGATFFHTASWAKVLKDAYGFQPVYFVVRQPGRIQSLLPMMDVDSWLTGRRGVSLPFTDECAPLCDDSGSFKNLYHVASGYGKSKKWKFIECRGGRPFFDGAAASVVFLGHRLDLRPGEATLFDGCESSVRRAVRKAERSALKIEVRHDLESVKDFFGLLCKTRKRHGVPPQPFHFFSSIHRHVLALGLGCVVLARVGAVPVAGAIYFHFGKTVIYKFGASDDRFKHLRANNLVMWEAIKIHSKNGFETLDFGRTSVINSGLQRFKLSWGASERQIEYVRHDLHSGRFASNLGDSEGTFAHLLRLMPIPFLRLFGAALYKHVA